MKTIDRILNVIVLFFTRNKFSRWHTHSVFCYITLGGYRLRSDYIDYTAKRYVKSAEYMKRYDQCNTPECYAQLSYKNNVRMLEKAMRGLKTRGKNQKN